MKIKNGNNANFYIPAEFRIYSHVMICVAVIFLCAVFYKSDTSNFNWNIIIPLAALTFIFLLRPFLTLSEDISYYLDDIPIYAAMFTLGTPSTLIVVLAGFMLFEAYKTLAKILKGKGPSLETMYLSLCNISHIMISYGIASIIFTAINKNHALTASLLNITAVAAASTAKFFLNASESAFSTYLFNRESSFPCILKKNFSGIWVHLLMLAPLGFIFAYLITNNPLASVFLAIPIMILYYACDAFKKTIAQANKIFQTLVRSIDKRDHYTFGHSQRVASYAKALAEHMRLPENEVTLTERAGKIHDIGKIALSDDILQKKERLTPAEAAKMMTHPSISLTIFKNLHELKKHIPAELASMHHERYDGAGYTLGLKGENIPLISRMLAVADTFDAMTSERVYRKKTPFGEAVEELNKLKGTQLDPAIVDSFTLLYKSGALEKIRSYWENAEKIYVKINKSEELEEKFMGLKQVFS